MGFFSLIGGLIGAGKAKKASRRAESAQLEFLNKALSQQQQQFDLTRSDYAPALSMLAPSIGALGDYAGLNGVNAQQSRIAELEASPLFEQLKRVGREGVLQNAAATGGLRGGNTQSALYDNDANALNQTLLQQLQQLGGLAGMGLGATDSASSFGANTANQISNLYGQQGQVRAGGLLTRGGINSQMWNNIGAYGDQVASSSATGPGGFGGFLRRAF